MKRFVIGILAHVDAGKTTMSEAILYETGKLKKMGRVDNRDAFLDTFALERARGITIFSKQAVFPLGDTFVTLLDTPGHVDFSAEMERTLQVLDYAVLIVSGADGVQGHTETLWRLLKRYRIPVFLFVNKMDQKGTDREAVLASLKERLDHGIVDFSGVSGNRDILGTSDETAEEIATCDEALLEAYLADGSLKTEDVRNAIQNRKLFPCFFGSALKLTGVREFLTALGEFASCPDYTKDFGAKVFKISRDETGVRMTHLKITGGNLKIRDSLSLDSDEKINQIRLYSGSKFEALKEAEPGMVVAVTGISGTGLRNCLRQCSSTPGAGPHIPDPTAIRNRLPHHAQKYAHAGGGRPAAPHCLERGAWRNSGTGHGRCADGDLKEPGSGPFRRGDRFWRRKYCLQGNDR